MQFWRDFLDERKRNIQKHNDTVPYDRAEYILSQVGDDCFDSGMIVIKFHEEGSEEWITITWDGKEVYSAFRELIFLPVHRFNYGDEWFNYLENIHNDLKSKERRAKAARFVDLD